MIGSIFDFLKEVVKKPLTSFIVASIFFFALSSFNINKTGEDKLTISTAETMNTGNIILLVIGSFFMLLTVYRLKQEGSRFKIKGFELKKNTDYKYSFNIKGYHEINIIYGKLNDFQEYDKDTLVILPANDKFDEECVDDPRTVLGAFAESLFPNGKEKFKADINDEKKKKGKKIFNIGEWIYFPNIKSENKSFNIGIVAVTHLTKENTIIAYPENVMLAFNGIHNLLAEKRLPKVYIPLIGSGHGGLKQELSFLNLLISIFKKLPNTLRKVNIIIYRNDNKLDIPIERMKDIVHFVLNYYR